MIHSKATHLAEHILAMEDDAYFNGHPEWEIIVQQAREIFAIPADPLGGESGPKEPRSPNSWNKDLLDAIDILQDAYEQVSNGEARFDLVGAKMRLAAQLNSDFIPVKKQSEMAVRL